MNADNGTYCNFTFNEIAFFYNFTGRVTRFRLWDLDQSELFTYYDSVWGPLSLKHTESLLSYYMFYGPNLTTFFYNYKYFEESVTSDTPYSCLDSSVIAAGSDLTYPYLQECFDGYFNIGYKCESNSLTYKTFL